MFFNLLMAKAKKKQQDYIELEYLESTGTQWIDTGFLSNQLYDKSLYIKMKTTGGTSSYAYNGAYHLSGTGLTIQFGLLATSDTLCRTTSNHFDPSYLNVTNIQKSEYTELMMTPTEYWVNGEFKANHQQTSVDKILETNNKFLIFGRSQYNQSNSITPMIISEFWIKDANGKFVQHLIPVLDKNLVPCMYDKVSGKYLYNQGDGEFKWKLPNQLEYLGVDGTQWIDTGFAPSNNTRVVGSVLFDKWLGNANYVFGVYGDNANFGFNVGSARAYFNVPWFNNAGLRVSVTPTVNTIYSYDISKDGMITNGQLFTDPLLIMEFQSQKTMYIGWCNGTTQNKLSGRIYPHKIYENDVLVQYLIPVYDKTLTPCMYDLVSKKYFYNNGTGQFKGYFEDGSQLLSYLASTGTQYIETGLTVTPTIGFLGEAEASLTDSSFETLAGYDTFFLPLAVVPSSKRVCMGYGDNTNAPTLYPLIDGSMIPSTQASSTNSSLFIKYSGRFRVCLNFKASNLWQFEDANIKYEIALPEVLPQDSTHTITVFGRKYDDNITNRFMWRGPIYKAIFTDGEEIIMNLIPVIKSDNTVCMYDSITKQYFVNKGTGSFTYGTQVNLFDPTKPSYVAGYISTNNNGNITPSTLTDTFYIPCKPNTTYLVKRTSYKEANQVWRVATTPTAPTVNMSTPHFTGGLINDLYLVIKSRDVDKYLIFSEGKTLHTDDLSKFTVLEIEDNNSLIA